MSQARLLDGYPSTTLVSNVRMFRIRTGTHRVIALFTGLAALVCARAGFAHHDPSDTAADLAAPMGLSDAGAIDDASMGSRLSSGSSLAFSFRYLATEQSPALGMLPVAIERDFLVTQLSAEHDVGSHFRLRAAIPSVTALPVGSAAFDAGLGDVRVGGLARMFLGTLRSHGAVDISMPTGDTNKGFGQGAFLVRAAGGLGGTWTESLSLSGEVGLSRAFRADNGLSIDYGVSSTLRIGPELSVGFQARAMTALVDRRMSTNVVLQQPRDAGATMLVLMPSATLRVSDRLSMFGGPQIPLGRQTFGFGVVMGVQSLL